MKIGIIGEFNEEYETHRALNDSLRHAEAALNETVDFSWVDTETIAAEKEDFVRRFDGIWSAPGSPFKSLEGSLKAIRIAREKNIPHLATCAGFQHTVVEIARNVLGIEDAQHEEYAPDAPNLFISRLKYSLAGRTLRTHLMPDSRSRSAYGTNVVRENYYCHYAVNPAVKEQLKLKGYFWSGRDDVGEWRILEVTRNDFFIATLFVPQVRSTPEAPHPLIMRFLQTIRRRTV